ncbi:D-amino-acid:oxygen oxidoreductase [Cryptosporangium aurantiacum]|uniref:D-amino-acid oxidase n=1 Tax=Cryptosporangium aurantiacum TaxID=134849 RepID=A0A1M7RMU7_9ACTN|nr:D-amino-acid:oxygen oxidoreductase [Cryptosporangium aurantiacum]
MVLGAGASGLTTALCLVEAGVPVRLVADRPPARTTSAVAGALWGPYVVDDERVVGWGFYSLTMFRALAADARSGVRLARGLEAAATYEAPPSWVRAMEDFAFVARVQLPPGFVSGWQYTAPLIDMPVYLGYLGERLAGYGVRMELIEPVGSLDAVAGLGDVVVNCAGLGARELVPDPELYPVQGQLVVVENPGVEEFFSDYPESETPTYVLPQGDKVVLGGSIRQNIESAEPDPAIGAEIRARCAAVVPSLATARVVAHRVGLRPVRPRVRLERVVHKGATIVHNYGHGGSGITVSWGCAAEVRDLLG